MANLKLGEDYSAILSALANDFDNVAKMAIYEGAKIAADEITAELESKHSVSGDLAKSMGIATMDKDKKGNWNTKIGFTGYDQKGVPNVIKARVLESGSSTRAKKPFVRPAMNRARNKAIAAMEKTVDEKIKKITKT